MGDQVASLARPTQAVVVCAGLGTRLRPITQRLPKPAISFLGVPLIAHTFAWLRAAGIERVVVNLHHLPHIMRATALAHGGGLELRFSYEPELLGTGGALVAARAQLEPVTARSPLLVLNGDCYYALAPNALTQLAAAKGAAEAALWLSDEPRYAELANVQVDPSGRIWRIAGSPAPGGPGALARPLSLALRPAAYLGAQLLDDRLLDRLPSGGVACMRDQGWLPALAAGAHLQGVALDGAAYDLGTPARYLAAYNELWGGEEAAVDGPLLKELRSLRP